MPASDVRTAVVEALGRTVAGRRRSSRCDRRPATKTAPNTRSQDSSRRFCSCRLKMWPTASRRSGDRASARRIVAYRRQHGLTPVPHAAGGARAAHGRVARVRRRIQRRSRQWPPQHRGGECSARAWHRARFGRMRCRHLARGSSRRNRRAEHRRQDAPLTGAMPGAPEGVRAQPMRRRTRRAPCAQPTSRSRAVAALARRAERHFGRPQDIEWAYADNALLPAPVTADHVARATAGSGRAHSPLGQQQHRRELQRRDDAADVFVCVGDLRARLPAVLPDDARSGRANRHGTTRRFATCWG